MTGGAPPRGARHLGYGIGLRPQHYDEVVERGPADAVLALALVHHLAIGNNVPLERIAELPAMDRPEA